MKTKKTVIAVCIAALFASTSVIAKEKWEYHEDRWDDTRSYGNVNIDQDSVQQWGPWEAFVEPAAGGPAGPSIGFLGAAGADPYRPLPTPTPIPVSEVCAAGAWCGFVVYRSYASSSEGDGYGGSYHNRPQAGLLELRPAPDQPTVVTVDGGEGTGMMSVKITPLIGSDPLLILPSGIAGSLPVKFGMDTTWVATRDGLANFSGYDGGEFNSTIEGQSVTGSWNAGIAGHNRIWAQGKESGDQYDVTPYMTMGGNLYVYVYGTVNGGSENSYSINVSDGAEGYVAGIQTSLGDMAALQAGRVSARYEGFTSGYKNTSYQSPVVVDVNFGTSTWSGTWNNGSDGNIGIGTDSSGRTYLVGQVGLNASGTLSGANFQSNSVSANDGQVSGSVQGSMYGPMAAGLGGIVNITKTQNVGSEVAKTSQGYSNAGYVDVFAAQKVLPNIAAQVAVPVPVSAFVPISGGPPPGPPPISVEGSVQGSTSAGMIGFSVPVSRSLTSIFK